MKTSRIEKPRTDATFETMQYGQWILTLLDVTGVRDADATRCATPDQLTRWYNSGLTVGQAATALLELMPAELVGLYHADRARLRERADREVAAMRGALRAARTGRSW